MPELPEVETMCRGIAGIVGGTIADVQRAACRLKPIAVSPRIDAFRRRVVGRRIQAIQRVGKRVLLRLDDQAAIVIEPRMTGLVLIGEPPDGEHLRLRMAVAESAVGQLLYWDRRGLGSVSLVPAEQWNQRFGAARLGPDALELDAQTLRARLAPSRRPIKVALLDQRALAGIGNLYASEILHVARIHPACRCDRVTPAQWHRLHAALQSVLREAIRCEGSTLSDGTYRNALSDPGSYQNLHRVYARGGQLCASCGRGIVQRLVQAQRATFFCPRCQPARKA